MCFANFQVTNDIISARQAAIFQDNLVSGSTYSLDLAVTGFYPVWAGLTGDDTWYQNNTGKLSWKPSTGGSPTYFIDGNVPTARVGDAVLFNDAGAGHLTVSIPLNVAPASVTVDSTLNYAFTGAGGIVDSTFAAAPKTSLIKKNSGMLTVSTPNTYTGGTTIVDGTIRTNNASALGAGVVTFAPSAPATAKVQLYGSTLAINGLATDPVPGTPVVENGASGPATLTINNSVAETFAGVLQNGGSGTLGVTYGGTADFVLGAVNTYGGSTTVGVGATNVYLRISAANALPHGTGAGNVYLNGGNLDLNGLSATINGLSCSPSAPSLITNTLLATTGVLTVGDNNASSDFSGSVLDTGTTGKVALAKIGSGTLTIEDPSVNGGGLANNYSGGTTLTQGTIKTYYANALGTGVLTMSPTTTLDLQAALNVRGLDGTGGTATTSAASSQTLTLLPATTALFAGVIQDGSGSALMNVQVNGPGTQTLTGSSTYTGVTTLSGGTLSIPVLASGGIASPLGKSTSDASNLVFNGGTLYYTGPNVSIDRGFTANGGVFQMDNNVTMTGPSPAQLPGPPRRSISRNSVWER